MPVFRATQVAFGLLNALLQLMRDDDGLNWIGAMWLGYALLGGLIGWAAARERVEADEHGVRLPGLVRTREFAWDEIAEVRPDTPAPWSQWLVLETRTGEVVNLRLEATETGLVERWQQELGRSENVGGDP